jgi:PIN domain nuclease of toxin-antitoxin system
VTESADLSIEKKNFIIAHLAQGIGVSAISCWEVAKLVEKQRLLLTIPVKEWITQALAEPGVVLLPLTPEIAVAST